MENKEILKALSFIAAELHIQNTISITNSEKRPLKVDFSYLSVEMMPKLIDHFMDYIKGGDFLPLPIMQKYINFERK